MTIGQNIYALRNKRHIAQKELAAAVNVSVSTISNYENGVHQPDAVVARKIARFFNVSVDYLYGLTKCEYPIYELQERTVSGFDGMEFLELARRLSDESQQELIRYMDFLDFRDRQVSERSADYQAVPVTEENEESKKSGENKKNTGNRENL